MEFLKYFLGLQILLSALAVMGIIYLVWRKVKKRNEEKFERRDN